jgi:hypothetical protein
MPHPVKQVPPPSFFLWGGGRQAAPKASNPNGRPLREITSFKFRECVFVWLNLKYFGRKKNQFLCIANSYTAHWSLAALGGHTVPSLPVVDAVNWT